MTDPALIYAHSPAWLGDDFDGCSCGWGPDERLTEPEAQWARHVAEALDAGGDAEPLPRIQVIPPTGLRPRPMTADERRAAIQRIEALRSKAGGLTLGQEMTLVALCVAESYQRAIKTTYAAGGRLPSRDA